ncbi:hypothetical protein ACNOYE_33805 [Nannocystaceae bacterium ST9]
MHRLGLVLALACSSSLLVGCPAANEPKPAGKGEAKSDEKKAADPHAKVHGEPGNPHADPGNPHAGLDMPSAPPMPAVEAGPPRDVTPTGVTRTEIVDGLALQVPEEWKLETPANTSMRKAEFVIPGPGGDVRLVVYRFAGGAGGFTANIERWKGQMTPPAGVEPTIVEREVGGLKLAGIDVAGRFAGQSMPGAPPQPAIDEARLLAVAIEQAGSDPWYLKLVGAKPTIDVWAGAWETLLGSLAPAPVGAPAVPPAPAP